MGPSSKNSRKSGHDLVGDDCSFCFAERSRLANSAYGAFIEILDFKCDRAKSEKFAMCAEMRSRR